MVGSTCKYITKIWMDGILWIWMNRLIVGAWAIFIDCGGHDQDMPKVSIRSGSCRCRVCLLWLLRFHRQLSFIIVKAVFSDSTLPAWTFCSEWCFIFRRFFLQISRLSVHLVHIILRRILKKKKKKKIPSPSSSSHLGCFT